MLHIQRYQDLGRMQIDWLNAHYHFSFSAYHNPDRMGVGPLRVINDDIVAAGGGFDMHPHRDMEIITYVRKGAISHEDSLGNVGKTSAGDVQVMSAGNGIVHAEHNDEDIDTNLYQIWIHPSKKGVKPRWETRAFPKEERSNGLALLVSGRPQDEGKGALYIHQDAAIFGGRLAKGVSIAQLLSERGYLLVSEGEVEVEGQLLRQGDGAEIEGVSKLTIDAKAPSEVLLIDLPMSATW